MKPCNKYWSEWKTVKSVHSIGHMRLSMLGGLLIGVIPCYGSVDTEYLCVKKQKPCRSACLDLD